MKAYIATVEAYNVLIPLDRLPPKHLIVIADDEEEAAFEARCLVSGCRPQKITAIEITEKGAYPLDKRIKIDN